MSDATYQPKTYRKDGGDTMVIANGGKLIVEPGGFFLGGNPTGAADYFVDGNVSATGDGTMASPYLTLAEAITASNTSIGLTANRWWARRNRIFVMGDQEIDEDLTILPEKCDVIGLGYDVEAFPRVLGNHVIAAAWPGCRFINMGFMSTGAGPVFTLPAYCHGFSIYGGAMWPRNAGSTIGLSITDCAHVTIKGLKMGLAVGAPSTGIFATGISILGTLGSHDTTIEDCFIQATAGILTASTCGCYNSIVKDNTIYATAKVVNDPTGLLFLSGNNFISATDGNTITDVITVNADLAVNNYITHSGTDLVESFPLLKTS